MDKWFYWVIALVVVSVGLLLGGLTYGDVVKDGRKHDRKMEKIAACESIEDGSDRTLCLFVADSNIRRG